MLKKTKKATDKNNPEWLKRDFASALSVQGKSLAEAATALRRTRGPQKSEKKIAISIRLKPEIVTHFKKGGAGWQQRIEAALLKVAGK